jgi:hypothetical protein
MDIVAVCLLVIGVIPWLSPIFDSVEIAGLKVELHKVQESLADTTQRTNDAQSSANIALTRP